ncbi:uncharacterized protein [Cherax quadricarinatus]|uniref:uncharacterized protein n=1 Tax=Cherax quadricarinatus TaxID=27406 RepID=UPI00237888AE|nr:uncharacterized protein LOC128701072 [Cherax quadricarinatus]
MGVPSLGTAERGVALSVFNQRTGTLVFHKVFPLWLYWAHWVDLSWHLTRVAPGRLVVMAVSISGTVGLRGAAQCLVHLGSLFAAHLPPTAHWEWIFVKGGRTISETVALKGTAHTHTLAPLSDMALPSAKGVLEHHRWQYCARYGAMGGLCDEGAPDPLPVPQGMALTLQSAPGSLPVTQGIALPIQGVPGSISVSQGMALPIQDVPSSLPVPQGMALPIQDVPGYLPVSQGMGLPIQNVPGSLPVPQGMALPHQEAPGLLPVPQGMTLPLHDVLAAVPIIVTAGTRHQYLYHALSSILAAPGARRANILVALGDAPASTVDLLRLMNFSYVTLNDASGHNDAFGHHNAASGHDNDASSHHNDRLFRYYRQVYRLIADRYPKAPSVILLDEDIEVSPDFFSFMSQTLWLLKVDPSLYCINAHSAGGVEGLAHDERRVLRGAVQVEWGYSVTLEFVREALSVWEATTSPNTLYYDFWLYINVRRGRECLFPEVSRTLHFGMGVNTNAFLKEKGPLRMPLVRDGPILLRDVWRLQLPTWTEDLTYNISRATPLSGNPCRATFLPGTPTGASLYVFYYRLDSLQEGRPDHYQFFNVAECLGMWSMSEQGHHRGIHIVRFTSSATLYLVGVPFSHYSHLRPITHELWDVDNLTDEDFLAMRNYTASRYNMEVANVNTTSDVLIQLLSTAD